jgi:hypothetical protein
VTSGWQEFYGTLWSAVATLPLYLSAREACRSQDGEINFAEEKLKLALQHSICARHKKTLKLSKATGKMPVLHF